MRHLFLLGASMLFLNIYADGYETPPTANTLSIVYTDTLKVNDNEKVFDVVEQMPSFPGGPQALFEYLSNNIHYPDAAKENGIQGRVIVTLVVERDGSPTGVTVVRSVDPSLDKEAIRVIRNMPRWNPGKQNGSTVRVKYMIPVTFKL